MENKIELTTSYLQDKKHAALTDRYNVIQPASVGQAMSAQGLQLASLSTGKAKHVDKIDFQRTLARYRGPEILPGVNLDIIYDSKKLGRGVDRILLGIYRLVCTNGLFVGSNFFRFDIRHTGKTYENLEQGIAAALSMRDQLIDSIRVMQNTILTESQVKEFADHAAKLIVPENAQNVRHRLLTVRRHEDATNDLWSVFNRVQENVMQGRKITYDLKSYDETKNVENVRVMTARPIKPNTGKDADINQKLFDLAQSIAA